jgi:hypothetical protein
MDICHFAKVDKENIRAIFTEDGKHRSCLEIPFLDRNGEKTLCIIGQNPSHANEIIADKTVNYLERYVYENLPQYSKIIVLNLYSIIDTNKYQIDDLVREECENTFDEIINENSDFLVIYGKLTNNGSFNFVERAKSLKSKLGGKAIYKIDIKSSYAPHPGNPKIYYGNYCYDIIEYAFEDIF